MTLSREPRIDTRVDGLGEDLNPSGAEGGILITLNGKPMQPFGRSREAVSTLQNGGENDLTMYERFPWIRTSRPCRWALWATRYVGSHAVHRSDATTRTGNNEDIDQWSLEDIECPSSSEEPR